MFHRAAGIGVLAAFDRGIYGDSFQLADEQLLRTFAASAANAVAIKHSVEADRLRAAIAAADAERRRWARDLHDQTLQSLGALRVMLSSALRRDDDQFREQAIRQAIEDIDSETGNLRGIITDLRPSMLDDLGLEPALEALVDRRREAGLEIMCQIDLPGSEHHGQKLAPELETTVYRLVQESLTNVAKHAHAQTCRVSVRAGDDAVTVEVTDDGRGYDTSLRTSGFGLAGMRERVYLSGGAIVVESGNGGTTVRARIPMAAPGTFMPVPSERAAG